MSLKKLTIHTDPRHTFESQRSLKQRRSLAAPTGLGERQITLSKRTKTMKSKKTNRKLRGKRLLRSTDLLDQLLHDAKCKRSSAAKLIKCASLIEYAVGAGKTWKNVHRVKLELNRAYTVRRVWADNSKGNPAVATWDKNGWTTIHGNFYPTTACGSVDVLV